MNDPKVGDVIRIVRDSHWYGTVVFERKLEIYRYTLGFFEDEQHREAGVFTPLCDSDLWIDGPDSKDGYVCNFGSYRSNQVQCFEVIES